MSSRWKKGGGGGVAEERWKMGMLKRECKVSGNFTWSISELWSVAKHFVWCR